MKAIDLPIPSEPIQIRGHFRKELEKGSRLMQANIKQGTWIASHLWTEIGWGNILKSCGITWQNFMEDVRNNYYNFIKWVNEEKSWEETIKDFIIIIEKRMR